MINLITINQMVIKEIIKNNTPNNNQNNNQQTDTSTQTSDDTAIISFVALALLAIAGFWMSRKKED